MVSLLRFYGRIFVFGIWSVMFGAVIVYLTAKSMAMVGTAPATTPMGPSFSLQAMIRDSLATLYRAGLGSLGVGFVFMLFGWTMFKTALS